MRRRSRRLFTTLLWLAIALLPLRGVAAVWMHGVAAAPPAVAADGQAQQPTASPCHGQAHAHDMAAVGDSAAPTDASHGCQLCDLCHGGVAVAPELPSVTPIVAAQSTLAPGTAPPCSGLPDGLYRPPR